MGWTTWRALEASLQRLQFRPAAEDPWLQLGFFPLTGSAPTAYMLEQRWRVARILLEAAKNGAWPDEDRTASALAAARLSKAYAACVQRLPAVHKQRRKEPK